VVHHDAFESNYTRSLLVVSKQEARVSETFKIVGFVAFQKQHQGVVLPKLGDSELVDEATFRRLFSGRTQMGSNYATIQILFCAKVK
jgi:hypothetical protein